ALKVEVLDLLQFLEAQLLHLDRNRHRIGVGRRARTIRVRGGAGRLQVLRRHERIHGTDRARNGGVQIHQSLTSKLTLRSMTPVSISGVSNPFARTVEGASAGLVKSRMES